MEERRRGFINLDERIGKLEVNTENRLTRLEVSIEKMEDDLKGIKSVLEKLSDKLNLAEDEIWQDLDIKEKSFNQRLQDLEKSKLKTSGFLTGIALFAGTAGNNLVEKIVKLFT